MAATTRVTFADWLAFDRTRREVQFVLDEAFDKLIAQFSFTRQKGLVQLRHLVTQLADEPEDSPLMRVFLLLQNEDNHNVLFRVVPLILVRTKFQPTSEITLEEKQTALELVHALCMLHPHSRVYFGAGKNVEALVNFLRVDKLQIHALLALQAALVDSRANQESFERLGGLKVVAKLMLNQKTPHELRRLCTEFLYLFMSPDQDTDEPRSGHTRIDSNGLTERGRNISSYIGPENLELLMNTVVLDNPAVAVQSMEAFLHELDEALDDQ